MVLPGFAATSKLIAEEGPTNKLFVNEYPDPELDIIASADVKTIELVSVTLVRATSNKGKPEPLTC